MTKKDQVKESQSKPTATATRASSGRQYAAASRRYFWIDTKSELQKVSWPNRETVVRASALVLFIVFISTAFIAGVDFCLASIFTTIRGI